MSAPPAYTGPGGYSPYPGAPSAPPSSVVSSLTAPAMPAAQPQSAPPAAVPSNWDLYCQQAEVPERIKGDLLQAAMYKTVCLFDDSGSMQSRVTPPGQNQFTSQSTRWSELNGDAMSIVQLITSINPQGVDVFFMNRPGQMGVTSVAQLGPMFAAPPSGGTPMIGAIRNIYNTYSSYRDPVLLIIVTDGEPSDGEYSDLFNVLYNKPPNFFVSMVECNDNEEEMDYLTGWDTQIPRFHNQEDYGEELNLVRRVNGPNAKFTRANYVQMIVLSPIFPQYAIDIRTAGGKINPFGGARGGGPNQFSGGGGPNQFAGGGAAAYNPGPQGQYRPGQYGARQQQGCCTIM